MITRVLSNSYFFDSDLLYLNVDFSVELMPSSLFSVFFNLEPNTFKKSKLAPCILSSVSHAHTSGSLENLAIDFELFATFLWF